jgi:hypothetical protein
VCIVTVLLMTPSSAVPRMQNPSSRLYRIFAVGHDLSVFSEQR